MFLKKILSLSVVMLILSAVHAQHDHGKITGQVKGMDDDGHSKPLPFANVYWSGSSIGVVADEDGYFEIEPSHDHHYLVFHFLGYRKDSLHLHAVAEDIEIELIPEVKLAEGVEIKDRNTGSFVSKISPLQSEHITEHGLQRLACCNLSESFENNATVDVGFADAVSGAKQIRMLGLDGKYSQIMLENIPTIRALASKYGLAYVPGSWMQSIQVSKGSSSVTNGFESVTGQINVELKKPQHSNKLHLNLYGNSEGRAELNVLTAWPLTERLATMLMVAASGNQRKHDENGDGFLDMPMQKQLNVLNRWEYEVHHKGHFQLLLNYLHDEREGGQKAYYDVSKTGFYGMNATSDRFQAIAKAGIMLGHDHSQSIGVQLSGIYQREESQFGLRNYRGEQRSLYGNLVYLLKADEKHHFSFGGSIQFDDYQQKYNDSVFNRQEPVPGIYTEYTFKPVEQFSVIAGMRYDYSAYYSKSLLSPRLHLRYGLTEQTVLRASAGKSWRSAVIFPENAVLLASNRTIIIAEKPNIEEAWNYGLNLTQDVPLTSDRELTFTFDLYRTDFQNQVIADVDQSARTVVISNLDGSSFASNVQAGLSGEVFRGLDLTLAFRYSDVQADYHGEQMRVPFVNRYKGLLSLSWRSKQDKWQIDLTNQLQGDARIPYTGDNPVVYQMPEKSPEYLIVHAQLTRRFTNWSIYLGAENLSNYTQDYPILAADDPFGEYFDASMVWGPVMGRMFYGGVRFDIP